MFSSNNAVVTDCESICMSTSDTDHCLRGDAPVLTTVTAVENVIPSYSNTVRLDPSRIGIEGEDVPWEQDMYVYRPVEVLRRVFTQMDDCVLIVNSENELESVTDLDPQSFGGVLVAECTDVTTAGDSESIQVNITDVQYLSVLYASALTVARHEKELSTRVLNDVPGYLVDKMQSKYTRSKRDLTRKMESSGFSTESVWVDGSTVAMYGVDL